MSFIELKNVSKRFGSLVVLHDLSLSIERGKCLVVIGASGWETGGTARSARAARNVGAARVARSTAPARS